MVWPLLDENLFVIFNQVDLLKNKFGFDEAFNYKEELDLNATLKRSVLFRNFSIKGLVWRG